MQIIPDVKHIISQYRYKRKTMTADSAPYSLSGLANARYTRKMTDATSQLTAVNALPAAVVAGVTR